MQTLQAQYLTNQEAIIKLNHLYEQMDQVIAIDEHLFREYVTLYVQKHTLSQDYFIAFCEHSIISKLFGQKARYLTSIAILQMFNLLLANTNQLNSLVYIFSQSSFHQYLFSKFSIFKESSQSIQYYVQLLKTIILKISTHNNNSLIKMFCNNRHPSFPLLTVVTTLASAWTLEGLVRVTAQQCVLQLINLINQRQIGRGYLTDLQFIIFFYQISCQAGQEGLDQQGDLKYIIDLIYALRNNKTSLQFLMNAIINNVIIKDISNIEKILKFIHNFIKQIEEYQDFPETLHRDLKTNLFNILKIIYFSRFLNSTYFATLKLIPQIKRIEQPNLIKEFQQRGEKISAYLLQYDNMDESEVNQRQKMMLFQNWILFNSNSEEVQKIKENNGKAKRNSSFLGFIFQKVDTVQDYIKNAMIAVGVNYQNLKFPIYKLTATLNFKTGIYLVQEIIVKTLNRDRSSLHGEQWNREDYDIHFNDFKGIFQLTNHFYKEIVKIIHKLQSKKVPLQFGFEKPKHQDNNSLFPQIYLPEYLFLYKFRQHFASIISENVLIVDSIQTIQAVAFLHEIISKLQIPKLLDKKSKQKILYKLQQIHQEINDITFGHHDLKGLIEYVHQKKYRRYKLLCYEEEETKSEVVVGNSKIEEKVFYFQFLSQLINPHLSSLYEFIVLEWNKLKNKDSTLFLKTVHHDTHSNIMAIEMDIQKGFFLQYRNENAEQNAVVIMEIKESDPKIKGQNKSLVMFSEHVDGFEMRSKLDAQILVSQVERIRSCRQEITTKLIVHYFDMVYNSLREIVYQK